MGQKLEGRLRNVKAKPVKMNTSMHNDHSRAIVIYNWMSRTLYVSPLEVN